MTNGCEWKCNLNSSFVGNGSERIARFMNVLLVTNIHCCWVDLEPVSQSVNQSINQSINHCSSGP